MPARVADCVIRYGQIGQVAARIRHVEWVKNGLLYECAVRLAWNLLDEVPEDLVTDITVAELAAWCKAQGNIVEIVDPGRRGSMRPFGVVKFCNPRCMSQQLMDRHQLPWVGTRRNIRAEVIMDLQFVLFLQDQDSHGGKLLGRWAEVKPGVCCIGYLLAPVGHTIALA